MLRSALSLELQQRNLKSARKNCCHEEPEGRTGFGPENTVLERRVRNEKLLGE